MDLGLSVSRPRCLLAGALATVVAAAAVAFLAPALGPIAAVARAGRLGDATFAEVLVGLCASVAVGVTAWLWVLTGLVLVDLLRGARSTRPGVPEVVRRGVLLVCGVALTTGLAPTSWADTGPSGAEVLSGLRLPERVAVRPTQPAPATPAPVRDVAVVAPGDTLWGIAGDRLGPGATAARVAAAWPRLYALNRETIGPDPGLLAPGQRLLVGGLGAEARR